jgi:hypothetical protein
VALGSKASLQSQKPRSSRWLLKGSFWASGTDSISLEEALIRRKGEMVRVPGRRSVQEYSFYLQSDFSVLI